MDLNDFIEVKLSEIKKELSIVLADEIIGFELGTPRFKLIFCTAKIDYCPGVVVEAIHGNEVKYLVYSPFMGMMSVLHDGTFLEISEVGKKYHNGYLNAEIIGEKDNIGMILYKDKIEGNVCKNIEQAQDLIKAFAAMSNSELRLEYYKQKAEIVPVMIDEVLYWFLNSKSYTRVSFGFFVNIANSVVTYRGVRFNDVSIIETGARYVSKAYKACRSGRYLYNGKIFCAVKDNSCFLTIAEAKGCYENVPEKDKAIFADYKERGFIPVMCLNEFHYLIAESCDKEKPAVLLMNALDGVITSFDYNISENVNYVQVGTYFENEGNPVKLTANGWESE